MMLSIQYIIGQLNIPIISFIGFSNSLQDAMIAVERINDIYELEEEPNTGTLKITSTLENIELQNVSFSYLESNNSFVLKNVDLLIPKGKVTAIVGESGSGKTSIIKLLIRFYKQTSGNIYIGGIDFADLEISAWRNRCGVVMQDGVVFPDTLTNNIAFGEKEPDIVKVMRVAKLVDLHEFAILLPDGYDTKIGTEINNLSQGQKQRLLIARTLYKNPDFIFLDEPTNSLDPITEKNVMKNILEYFAGKTVLIVAHRLKTIQQADQIIVMEKGKVAETGTHDSLITAKGLYYKMININE